MRALLCLMVGLAASLPGVAGSGCVPLTRSRLRASTLGATLLLVSLLSAAAIAAQKARMVGLRVDDGVRVERAFERAVDCESPAGETRSHRGIINGKPFVALAINCNFVGGNAQWTALMVGFHDGKRLTRVVAFPSVLMPASEFAVRGDRLIYRSAFVKDSDARCCPTGKAVVEIDAERALGAVRPAGPAQAFPPYRGQWLK